MTSVDSRANLQVGQRIRELRIARGLTLTETARRAGVSKSLLSEVERANANASLGVLHAIAEVLGVPFFRLFVETDHTSSLVRKSERIELQVPGSSMKRELLVPDLHRRMVLLVAHLEPGESSSPDTPARHEGEECVLVLSGRVEINMDGSLIVLDEGDCLYFDAKTPHTMRNINDGPSKVLAALTGEP